MMDLKKFHPWLVKKIKSLKLFDKKEKLSKGLSLKQTQELLVKTNQDYLKLQRRLNDAQVQFERLKLIVDNTPCTISWINDRLEYEGINETLLRLTGQKREEYLGKPIGFQTKDNYFHRFAKELFSSDENTLQKELASTFGAEKKHFWVVGSKYSEGKGAVIIGVETTALKKTEEKLKQVEHLIDIDDLTGLYNMRSMYEKLETELVRGQRFHHSTAVVMIDMDHFKTVNDSNDHLFGSFVLTEIGRMLKQSVRQVDFAARYGGDEFMIVLPQADQKGVEAFCERVRKKIEEHLFKNEHYEIKLTASFGYALSNPGVGDLSSKSLIRVADFALYNAKRGGRNRVSGIAQKDQPEKFDPNYKINY
jgi:diguanylate cyclase (GGDEF)-like protein